MYLEMDWLNTTFTANYPYPNLECTVNFKCDADGSISSDIVVVSIDYRNSKPWGYTNTWILSSLPTSDLDIWSGESVTVDVSQLFSMTACASTYWKINECL